MPFPETISLVTDLKVLEKGFLSPRTELAECNLRSLGNYQKRQLSRNLDCQQLEDNFIF
jgi:hypothetical protein